MTSNEAFLRFRNKINKDNTSDNTLIEAGTFVDMFNEQQRVWFIDQFANNANDKLYRLAKLRVTNAQFNNGLVKPEFVEYTLPENFYRIDNGVAFCSKNNCKKQPVYIEESKSRNKSIQLFDALSKPSFEFEWTFCTFGNGKKIQVYKTDFVINYIVLDYYRYPNNINIEGTELIDGTISVNIDPELDDLYVEEVINRCAVEFMRNFLSSPDVAVAKTRIDSEK